MCGLENTSGFVQGGHGYKHFPKLASSPLSRPSCQPLAAPRPLPGQGAFQGSAIAQGSLGHHTWTLPSGLSLVMVLSLDEMQPAWKRRGEHIQLKPVGFVCLFLFFLYESVCCLIELSIWDRVTKTKKFFSLSLFFFYLFIFFSLFLCCYAVGTMSLEGNGRNFITTAGALSTSITKNSDK